MCRAYVVLIPSRWFTSIYGPLVAIVYLWMVYANIWDGQNKTPTRQWLIQWIVSDCTSCCAVHRFGGGLLFGAVTFGVNAKHGYNNVVGRPNLGITGTPILREVRNK